MGSIEEEFQKAVKYIQELPKEGPYKPKDDEKLRFYSLYKQAMEGPCTKSKPSFFNFTAKAKWTAWTGLGQLSKEEAMTQYVDEFKKIRSRFETASAARRAENGCGQLVSQ